MLPRRLTFAAARTYAAPVPSTPSATTASALCQLKLDSGSTAIPNGAVSTRATACARHSTGSGPYRSSNGRATFNATP